MTGYPVTVLDAGAVAGFPCTLARGVVRWDCVCVYLCAPGFVNGVWWCVRVARLVFWWGVLLRASRCARLAVCLSAILGVLRVSIALGEEDAVG